MLLLLLVRHGLTFIEVIMRKDRKLLKGKRFCRLLVLEDLVKDKRAHCKCLCDCGTVKTTGRRHIDE